MSSSATFAVAGLVALCSCAKHPESITAAVIGANAYCGSSCSPNRHPTRNVSDHTCVSTEFSPGLASNEAMAAYSALPRERQRGRSSGLVPYA